MDLKVQAHLLGPDLNYDRSMRASFRVKAEHEGLVMFSPFRFKVADLDLEAVNRKVPLEDLIRQDNVASSV